ncbi:unnamed protein product, partial [Discosporangium mesarthrocarpum]
MMPVEEVSSMVERLRDDVISLTETFSLERAAWASRTCSAAQQNLTEELEERLRKHWPRKGRIEV